MREAQNMLETLSHEFTVVQEALATWRRGSRARSTTPEQWQSWLDAVRVIQHCRSVSGADLPIRRLSATLFSDSKRIETLAPVLDVLLQNDLQALQRSDEEVFGELGLVKFPPTLLVAAEGVVHLADVRAALLRPYIGLAPQAIQSFSGMDGARQVLSVENLTTFHELSRQLKRDDGRVLIYSAGMPSPSWLRIYGLLLAAVPAGAAVIHWGDADAGGFRIAHYIAAAAARSEHRLRLHGMDGGLCGEGTAIARKSLKDGEVEAIAAICDRWGWTCEAAWMRSTRSAVEQESMRPELPAVA